MARRRGPWTVGAALAHLLVLISAVHGMRGARGGPAAAGDAWLLDRAHKKKGVMSELQRSTAPFPAF